MGIFDVQGLGAGGALLHQTASPAMTEIAQQNQAIRENRPLDVIEQGSAEALQNLQMGLTDATGTLQPSIGQGQQLTGELQNLLMGNTPIDQIPGFNAMSDARRQAVGDLGTGMAGTGKFFSGTTASRAGDIGGAMQNQLMQQRIQNLMMGAQPGQQATSQLAGMQMGAGTTGAQIPMTAGTNIANIIMGQQAQQQQAQQAADANQSGFLSDVLGLAGTVGGFLMGGPAGAGVGGTIGRGVGNMGENIATGGR